MEAGGAGALSRSDVASRGSSPRGYARGWSPWPPPVSPLHRPWEQARPHGPRGGKGAVSPPTCVSNLVLCPEREGAKLMRLLLRAVELVHFFCMTGLECSRYSKRMARKEFLARPLYRPRALSLASSSQLPLFDPKHLE